MKPALRRALVVLLTIALPLGLYKLVLLRREAFFERQLEVLGRWPYAHFPTDAARTLLQAKEGPARILAEARQRPYEWRLGAVRALSSTRQRDAAPLLAVFAHDDPCDTVRVLAVSGLVLLNWPERPSAEVLGVLVDCLDDTDSSVWHEAQRKLMGIHPEGPDALFRALHDARPRVRRRAAAALAYAPWDTDPRAERLIEELTKSHDEHVRTSLARALAAGSWLQAGEWLRPFTDDPNPNVRRLARETVAFWQGEQRALARKRRLMP